ncbi:uncharacterized protein PODANS_1_18040 [Podospora anserina S mat+]|uniref:Podospora anserina S mat+ genomic DNA chromosome 1, supercontig 4 n=1 Tax=Podospora anserina (strain S / ATCC MYA-4624 / DSM 980 / FGSC 10383) TaxID=515849 RepID=B2AU59_PODAN|nr:uncharacterized protein PODANS_1_18040 [Podospora anserina S mat+]CAP67932.1 unnamed protein product [Podospora anserina S mat+]CDP24192.1 Putative protein of unknown function [Podospora anserina S mat+]
MKMAAITASAPGRIDYYAQSLYPSTTTSAAFKRGTGETLPGFPSQYEGERVWTGSKWLDPNLEKSYIVQIDKDDLLEVENALRHFQGLNVPPGLLSRDTFPLPKGLSHRLRKVSQDCYNGRGFAIVRGISPDRFTDEENVLVFGGISSYIAPTRGFQDVHRELVTCHVLSEDMRPGSKEQNLRPAFTNGRLAFHTDVGDILALHTLGVSDTGGETMIASACQIYNEMAESRHDLIQELAQNWAFFHSQDYYTDGTPLLTNAPGDKLVFQFSRLPITGFRSQGANPTLPPPSEKRLEAMAKVEELAWKHAFPLPREPGDMAYINNLCLMHARSAFDVDEEGNPLPSKRHLVKLMLQDPELAWELPQHLGWYLERVYGPNQEDGGRTEKWQLSVKDESLPDGRIWAGSGALSNG